jgi:hypothetical protein
MISVVAGEADEGPRPSPIHLVPVPCLSPIPVAVAAPRHPGRDRDDAIMPCLSFPDDDGGFLMHRGGNNVPFDDGHVQGSSRSTRRR